jgi:anti-sigma regulatory factor (Ser/Thr protein kinase)
MSKRFSETFTGVPASLESSRRFIHNILDEMGWADREIDLQLAIGEVTQNIIRYGFQVMDPGNQFTIEIHIDATVMRCVIRDNAPLSNPDDWLTRAKLRRPDQGGYGLSIIDAIADEYTIDPSRNGNVSCLMFSRESKV